MGGQFERNLHLYYKQEVYQIYPEYWIIKAGIFDEEQVNNVLGEWVYFLKTGEVQDSFSAPGLTEAKEKLDMLKLSPEERAENDAYVQRVRRLAGYRETEMTDAVDLINQGKLEKESVKPTVVRTDDQSVIVKISILGVP